MNPYEYTPAPPQDLRTDPATGETVFATDLTLRRRRLALYAVRSTLIYLALSAVIGLVTSGNITRLMHTKPLLWLVMIGMTTWITWSRNSWGTEIGIDGDSLILRAGNQEKRRIPVSSIRHLKLKSDSVLVTYQGERSLMMLFIARETFTRETWDRLHAQFVELRKNLPETAPMWKELLRSQLDNSLPSVVPKAGSSPAESRTDTTPTIR